VSSSWMSKRLMSVFTVMAALYFTFSQLLTERKL
jgi:hypothetical protein